jgi:hypothetical protein
MQAGNACNEFRASLKEAEQLVIELAKLADQHRQHVVCRDQQTAAEVLARSEVLSTRLLSLLDGADDLRPTPAECDEILELKVGSSCGLCESSAAQRPVRVCAGLDTTTLVLYCQICLDPDLTFCLCCCLS